MLIGCNQFVEMLIADTDDDATKIVKFLKDHCAAHAVVRGVDDDCTWAYVPVLTFNELAVEFDLRYPDGEPWRY